MTWNEVKKEVENAVNEEISAVIKKYNMEFSCEFEMSNKITEYAVKVKNSDGTTTCTILQYYCSSGEKPSEYISYHIQLDQCTDVEMHQSHHRKRVSTEILDVNIFKHTDPVQMHYRTYHNCKLLLVETYKSLLKLYEVTLDEQEKSVDPE